MLIKNNSLTFELKESAIFLQIDKKNNREILYSDIKKAHIDIERLAPLYRTLSILTSCFISLISVFLIHLDLIFVSCCLIMGIIIIIKKDFNVYKLEIHLHDGEILKNKIPIRIRREVIDSLFEIRKRIFISRT
jgi:hypothetical protein